MHVAAASLTTEAPAKTKPGASNKSVMTTKATALSSSSCSSDAVPAAERADSPPDAAACPAGAQAAACPLTAGAAEEPLVAAEAEEPRVAAEAAAGAAEQSLVAEDAAAASPDKQFRSNELFELAPHTGPQVNHACTYL